LQACSLFRRSLVDLASLEQCFPFLPSSWAMAWASHVRFASLTLFRTKMPFGSELDVHLMAIGQMGLPRY